MKFSKNWLQEYIVEQLPTDKVIEEVLNKKAFEVEEIFLITKTQTSQTGTDHADNTTDSVFDIKVLPNRAHDALGHHGMAYELCASLALTFNKEKEVIADESFFDKEVATVPVSIDDTVACTRFMSLRMDNVTVGESPRWLKERLEAIGQRSINNIVDITNYVQFALNKPMHAYDARSIKGTLRARFAKAGETLVTLDEKNLILDEKTLVIADDEKVLGLAGIKGGKYSGIQADTTSIILESANFNPVLIRKTAERYGIRTDASKRFENGIANNLVIEGLHMTANLIHSICGQAHKSAVTDIYPKKDVPYYVGISQQELNDILGTVYEDEHITKTLERLSFPYEVITPHEYITEVYPTLVGAGYKNPSSMREDAPGMFSCSSLVSYLYKGIWMPSLSIDKYVFSKKITEAELTFGDCVFANTGEGAIRFESVEFLRGTKVPEGIDHVGMYVGDGKVLHASKRTGMVAVQSMDEFKSGRAIVGFGRIADDLHEKRYVVRVPSVRLDIRIKEDLAEEIGRIIGYETLTPVLPKLTRQGLLHKRAFYENTIREILFARGFSEVMTYSFGDIGEVQLVKGLADDKEKLRNTLGHGMLDALARNLYNAPLLGEKTIAIFEFGNVFMEDKDPRKKERRKFAFGFACSTKKEREELVVLLESIRKTMVSIFKKEDLDIDLYDKSDLLNTEIGFYHTKTIMVMEIDFDTMIEESPEPITYEAPTFASLPTITYKAVSAYPFITRDIAMWVPSDVTWESILSLCHEVPNPLVARIDLFDTFTKEIEGVKKTSYAFRLVFQSYEKTLTDDEVNGYMESYYNLFKEKGYEIR